MRTRYTIWEQTPLKWHKFMAYFAIPLSILVNIGAISGCIDELKYAYGTPVMWIFSVDTIFVFASLLFCVLAFIGCLPKVRKWYGPVSLILVYVLKILYGVFSAWIGIIYQLDSSFVSSAITQIVMGTIFFIINFFYYTKRRLLFAPYKNVAFNHDVSSETRYTEEPEYGAAIEDGKQEAESSLDLLAQLRDEIDRDKNDQ